MTHPHDPFRALHLAHDLIAVLPPVLDGVARRDRALADQLRRAAQSVALNLAEAGGHTAGNRRLRIESALGSARETKTALHIAACWRYADREQIAKAHALADRCCGCCWRLLHPR